MCRLFFALFFFLVSATTSSSAVPAAASNYRTPESPVRFGLFSEADWAEFHRLYRTVQGSWDMREQRERLLRYAKDQLEMALPRIRANFSLPGNNKMKGLDLVMPGNGYNDIAYGGMVEVLNLLELTPRDADAPTPADSEENSRIPEEPFLQIGKRMGASGGATMALWSAAMDMDRVLQLHQVWQLFFLKNRGAFLRAYLAQPAILATAYAESLRSDADWERARQNVVIIARCGRNWFEWKNTFFRNFQTKEQLVQTVYASDDVSIRGAVVGSSIDSFTTTTGESCCDGGQVGLLPADDRFTPARENFGLLHYNVLPGGGLKNFAQASYPTKESIEYLFKAGVDTVLKALQSGDLEALHDKGGVTEGRIVIMLGEGGGRVTEEEYTKRMGSAPSGGVDVDLGSPWSGVKWDVK